MTLIRSMIPKIGIEVVEMAMTSDLTTKAAEIRAGLVADWRKAMEGVTPGPWQKGTKRTLGYVCESNDQSDGMLIPIADVYGENPDADLAWIARCSPTGIDDLLALIEQQAAELAEARAGNERLEARRFSEVATWQGKYSHAKSERDELLREKERLEAALEPFARADRALGRTPGSDRTFRLETDTGYREIDRDAFRRARSVLENSKAGLADANSKSPDPNSQSERIAVLEAALRPFAKAAEHDIGSTETDADIFQQMGEYNRAPKITVGDMRRARSALAPLGEE